MFVGDRLKSVARFLWEIIKNWADFPKKFPLNVFFVSSKRIYGERKLFYYICRKFGV